MKIVEELILLSEGGVVERKKRISRMVARIVEQEIIPQAKKSAAAGDYYITVELRYPEDICSFLVVELTALELSCEFMFKSPDFSMLRVSWKKK